ncbi:hypothetical protein [Streptomyces sp. H27-C3]|uniref:hypothetical protein n=1 Tax=Streptomyces sp. H27-C3 TaxID=3046305 RepID=UPI0024BA4030|nr:hypothetical protein [Streptomyces sp. H27-C3]MDJ0461425.1 hypothetical protein [Streptomyces sp. H27-C3]
MKYVNITPVSAASVDPQWREQNRQAPVGLPSFLAEFRILELEHQLGAQPLDDDYAIMYDDALNVVSQAVDQTFDDVNDIEERGSDAPVMPSKEDVYNTMIDMSILGTSDGARRVNRIHGASGTFGYDDSRGTEKWPVCKPVPVIEYPVPPVADPPKGPCGCTAPTRRYSRVRAPESASPWRVTKPRCPRSYADGGAGASRNGVTAGAGAGDVRTS